MLEDFNWEKITISREKKSYGSWDPWQKILRASKEKKNSGHGHLGAVISARPFRHNLFRRETVPALGTFWRTVKGVIKKL